MDPTPFLPPRAGFWRRLAAWSIDVVAASLVIAVIGSLAYAASQGRVQTGPFGMVMSTCRDADRIPDGLDPPPLVGSNYASVCTAGSIPGLTMMRTLLVGRKVTSGGREDRTWNSYSLGPDGTPVQAFDASWIGQVGFVVYLFASLMRWGRTLGLRLSRARLIVPSAPARAGVPFRSLAIRAGVAIGGFIPAILICGIALVWAKTDLEHAPVVLLTILALAAAAVWSGWNAVLAARKADPVYDRAAHLALVLDRPADRENSPLPSGAPSM